MSWGSNGENVTTSRKIYITPKFITYLLSIDGLAKPSVPSIMFIR
jgi:hypothetical protein